MLFSKNLFATLFAVAAVSFIGFPVGLGKRTEIVTLCPDLWNGINIQQCFSADWKVRECIIDVGDYNSTISTIYIGPHASCILYSGFNCTGAEYELQGTDDGWEELTGGWDNFVTSLRCHSRD